MSAAAIIIPSPARAAASRANGARSRGPLSPETKAISRKNAVRHSLTATICLPDEDAAEVAKLFDDLKSQFDPRTPMGEILAHRVALHATRLKRCAAHEAAYLSEKIRHAVAEYDETRRREVEALMAGLGESPASTVRGLLRTPEGTEALIRAWHDLRADLDRAGVRCWTSTHCDRANNLLGRRTDEIPISRVNELSFAIWGRFELLRPGDGEGLDDASRRTWAKEALVALIDEELEALRQCFETLDHEAFEQDREEAPRRALFDDSKAAILARRYEAAAERGMFRALNELRKLEKEAAEAPSPVVKVSPSCPIGPSGSFGAAPEPRDEPIDESESDGGEASAPVLPRTIRVAFGPALLVEEGAEGSIPGHTAANGWDEGR